MRHGTVRRRLASWTDPALVFSALHRDSPRSFWLDSGVDANLGMSFIGTSESWVTASVANSTVTEHPSGTQTKGTIFDFLRERVTPGREIGVPLGWVGWFGYELHEQTMVRKIHPRLGRSSRHPDAGLLHIHRLVAFDHEARTVELVALGERWTPSLELWRREVELALDGYVLPTALVDPAGTADANWRDGDAEYAAKIRRCQETIRSGEAYQLCLTNEASVDTHPHPLETYLRLRQSSPTHHGSLIRFGDVSLLSASPETFLTVRAGYVESRPIKGTRPRGTTPVHDLRLRDELLNSPKERAENLMIVDLMRNDIGRIAQIGTVTVPSLLAVESYAHVHQLVSTVRARLAEGIHPADAIAACFPAGSMTGAPKSRAVELLDELEGRPRGVYSGAVGYVGVDGSVNLAMTIRSIVLDSQGATIGAGGGITALSEPTEEVAEVKLKARALLDVLGVVSVTSPSPAQPPVD